jgi:hypothetical protein
MTLDTIIVCRDIREECIGGYRFIPSGDIGCREPGLVVFPHREAWICSSKLGSVLQSFLDPFHSGPTEIWLETVEVMFLGLNISGMHLIEASIHIELKILVVLKVKSDVVFC